jgi:signal transduction histidine kinase
MAIETLIVTLAMMSLVYLASQAGGLSWWIVQGGAVLLWVGIELVALHAVLRWGERRQHQVRVTIAAAYATAAAVSAIVNMGYLLLAARLGLPTVAHDLAEAAQRGAINGLFILGIWSLMYVVPRMAQEARDRERRRYEQQRAADRDRIRATLEPHFVLNTLNMIAGLVGKQPEQARELIGDLGDLLRDVVRNSDRACHAAADEIAWLERYARLLEARHPGRLSIRLQLADDARSIPIPIMLLQPVLENAIHHGALQGSGHVEVDVRLAGGMLRCTVDDDGPGLSPHPARATARGIELVRHRLSLDAPGGTFELANRERGTRATLLIPVVR